MRFSHALLVGTNFAEVKAARADFSDADLSETNFRDADLEGANFSQPARGWPMQRYFMRRFEREPGEPYDYNFPDFTCANLKGADFSWHPLLFVYPGNLTVNITGFPPRFNGANLEGADFQKLVMIGLAPVEYSGWPFSSAVGLDAAGTAFEVGNGLQLSLTPIDPTADLVDKLPTGPGYDTNEYSPFASSHLNIRDTFLTAQWEGARFPRSVRQILENRYLSRRTDRPACKTQ
jgi:uncharacterized protein YjbI with pentapeptide repeats